MTETTLGPGLANRIIAALLAAPWLLGLLAVPFAAEPVLLLILLAVVALPLVPACLQACSTTILSERGIGRRNLFGAVRWLDWADVQRIRMNRGRFDNRDVVIVGKRRKIAFSNLRPGFSRAVLTLLEQARARGIDMQPGLLSGTLAQWRRGARRGALGLLDGPGPE